MTNPITTLICPSCGGRLSVSKSASRSTCVFCGNEHVVHRAGGAAYLEPIAADVGQIRTGVDRTAAELAIQRLTKEIGELESNLELVKNSEVPKVSIPLSDYETGLMLLAILSPLGLCSPYLWWLPLVFIPLYLYVWNKRISATIKKKQSATQEKQDAIAAAESKVNDKKAALERTRKLLD